jgi:hypothetical protein
MVSASRLPFPHESESSTGGRYGADGVSIVRDFAKSPRGTASASGLRYLEPYGQIV